MKKWLPVLVISIILFTPSLARAFEAASTYKVSDKQAISGDIMSNLPGVGLVRSQTPYDNYLFGVFQDDPLIVYRKTNPDPADHPIIREGDSVVNVTDFNGPIHAGDLITTSPISGKGMKATLPGYMLGSATSEVTQTGTINYQGKTYQLGQVNVALRIQSVDSLNSNGSVSFLSLFNKNFSKNIQDPQKFSIFFRYTLAGLVAVIAFLFAFFGFSRSVARSIEAIGRNPLAKGSIQSSIIIQAIITLATLLGALIISFGIIKF